MSGNMTMQSQMSLQSHMAMQNYLVTQNYMAYTGHGGAAVSSNPLYQSQASGGFAVQADPYWLQRGHGASGQHLSFPTMTTAAAPGFALEVTNPLQPVTSLPATSTRPIAPSQHGPKGSSRRGRHVVFGPPSSKQPVEELSKKFAALDLLGSSRNRPGPRKSCLKKPQRTAGLSLCKGDAGLRDFATAAAAELVASNKGLRPRLDCARKRAARKAGRRLATSLKSRPMPLQFAKNWFWKGIDFPKCHCHRKIRDHDANCPIERVLNERLEVARQRSRALAVQAIARGSMDLTMQVVTNGSRRHLAAIRIFQHFQHVTKIGSYTGPERAHAVAGSGKAAFSPWYQDMSTALSAQRTAVIDEEEEEELERV